MRLIEYYYDVPLPNTYSATIQILKTGRAMAEAGRDFTFAAREPAVPEEALLAALGIEPHPRLAIVGRFPRWPQGPKLRRLALGVRPPPGLGDGRRAIVSRGESGMLVAPAIGRLRKRPVFAYELHRLAFVTEAERILGRRLEPGEDLPEAAARIRRREARTIAAADALIFLTEALRERAREAFGFRGPSVVAPSGVDLPAAVPAHAPEVDIVCLGKIEPRKGVDIALRVLRELPGLRLRLIGDGSGMAEAGRLAAALGVADRAHFVGRIDHAAVPAALARARIGLVPLPRGVDAVSERFTSPLKLLEMMAAGLPVVASDLPSTRAVCTDGVHALLAPPEAPEHLAAGIRRLLGDPDLAARLGAAGRRRAADFGWARRAATIGELVDGVPHAHPYAHGNADPAPAPG